MTQNEDAFWRFCAATLAVSGVADLSRALQERFAADQSLVLYMLWRGTQGARLDHVEMDQALAAAAHWRTRVVAPLQQVFRHLRQPPPGFIGADALMQSVQRAQAEAERLAQAALAGLRPGGPQTCSAPDPAAMRANLDAYLDGLDLADGASDSNDQKPDGAMRAALVTAGLHAAQAEPAPPVA